MLHKASYTSVWDDNVVLESICDYDDETHEVICYELVSEEDTEGIEVLTDEFVTLDDGTIIREKFKY
jgi:hypothetical protein